MQSRVAPQFKKGGHAEFRDNHIHHHTPQAPKHGRDHHHHHHDPHHLHHSKTVRHMDSNRKQHRGEWDKPDVNKTIKKGVEQQQVQEEAGVNNPYQLVNHLVRRTHFTSEQVCPLSNLSQYVWNGLMEIQRISNFTKSVWTMDIFRSTSCSLF